MMRVSGKVKRKIGRFFFPLLLLGCFSCAAPQGSPEHHFDVVSSHLETGGSVYTVNYLPDLAAQGKKAIARKREAMWRQSLSPEWRRQLDQKLSWLELGWELSGLSSCTGWGYSSVNLSSGESKVRNRFFLAMDPEAKPGILQNLFGKKNHPFPFRPQDLPQSCFFSGAVRLCPDAFWNALKASGKFGEEFLLQIPEEFPLEELSRSMQGWWTIALVRTDGEIGFRIGIPDLDGNASRIIRNASLCILGFQEEKPGRLLQAKPGKKDSLLISLEPGTIFFFSSLKVEALFADPAAPKWGDQPGFSDFVSEIPKQGIAFGFSRGSAPLSQCFPDFSPPHSGTLPEWTIGDFSGALTWEKEGYLWSEKGSFDWGERFFTSLLTTGDALFEACAFAAQQNEIPEQEPAPEEKQDAPEPDASDRDTDAHLLSLGKALLASRRPDGSFPQKESVSLFQDLLDRKLIEAQTLICPDAARPVLPAQTRLTWKHCSYCYFPWDGKGFQGKKRPLLMDRPGNHPAFFHVFFSDGTMQTFTLPRPDSCRRMISHLYTVCSWEEEDFRRLMQQAEQLDQELNQE